MHSSTQRPNPPLSVADGASNCAHGKTGVDRTGRHSTRLNPVRPAILPSYGADILLANVPGKLARARRRRLRSYLEPPDCSANYGSARNCVVRFMAASQNDVSAITFAPSGIVGAGFGLAGSSIIQPPPLTGASFLLGPAHQRRFASQDRLVVFGSRLLLISRRCTSPC